MGTCNAVSTKHLDGQTELIGDHLWTVYPGPVYVLKKGLTEESIVRLRAELEILRNHYTRHIRGPVEVYDGVDNSAKMLCTYNYYSAARPGEPAPIACLEIANSYLNDFGKSGNACLALHYTGNLSNLPWHTDMSGHGGPVLTLSWGAEATFGWEACSKEDSSKVGSWLNRGRQRFKHIVQEGDVVFFDGGRIPHVVTDVQGERYNVQVRVYDASIELADLPLDSWRRGYELKRSRYPNASCLTKWYQPDCKPDQLLSSIQAMYLDLVIHIIRNETEREANTLYDCSPHDLDRAQARCQALQERGMQPGALQLFSRYVCLLKKASTQQIYCPSAGASHLSSSDRNGLLQHARAHLEWLKRVSGHSIALDQWDVYSWFVANNPSAHSLCDRAQLENTQSCVEIAVREEIPGDLIETGVWQGGQTILMRAVLKAYNITDRKVYVADSFQGLPDVDAANAPDDALALGVLDGIGRFQVTADHVRNNFACYDLLDEQVVFLEGWFQDTLHKASFVCFAVVRLDGDFYESTNVAISHLYPRLSKGGFIIIDDYGCPFGCKRAVDDYRAQHGITAPLFRVNNQTVYWRKPF